MVLHFQESVPGPRIIFSESGHHNQDLQASLDRLNRRGVYRDLSTVCIVPTRGSIPARVVQSWWNLQTPMNQSFARVFAMGMEVGHAYSSTLEAVLQDPTLSRFKYVLTLEDDNLPPADGLLKLFEGIVAGYDVCGGLYWTKGEGGMPMIYGDPNVYPLNFVPQLPRPQCLQRCHGLGMGFTLFKMKLFKDKRLPRPWFQTVQGPQAFTQDLWFFNNAGKYGYRFCCNTACMVGHLDPDRDIVW
jgi:hypothetical protein